MANRSTRILGQGKSNLTPGTSITVQNIDKGNIMAQFVVSNLNAAAGGIVHICGMDGVEALTVFPQTAVTLETDSAFKVLADASNADSSGHVTIVVGQLFLRGI